MNEQNEKKTKNIFSIMEEEVLNFWDKAKIFKKSVNKDAPRGNYVFYDGPPFGTGEPHYGHLLSSISKDVIPRFWTMQGYRVERRWGWDCHGLPIENIIEKDLKISGKKQIEKIGVAQFCETCRSRVLDYADIWEVMIRRIGRWVEFKNSYKTMDTDYMESVWWAFKELYKKKLIYQGRKVQLYCPRCETPISNFEVAMDNSYKDITEESVYAKFKITSKIPPQILPLSKGEKERGGGSVYILAWTTTPWTLPGNVALAVGENIDYVIVRTTDDTENTDNTENEKIAHDFEYFILAKERVEEVLGDKKYKILKELKGKELVGLEYEPLFNIPAFKESGKRVYRVFAADFVTTTDGTGVVHTAVMYGEDDYNLGMKYDLPVIPSLDEKGIFNDTVPQFKGVFFKKADKLIVKDLKQRYLAFKTEMFTHAYPFCHRCDTQLFYSAIPAWFIAISKLKKRLLELNERINWFPEHLKRGRFALGISEAPDWNISRNRYFGTPIPVWQCDQCGEMEIIGSVKELDEKKKTKNNFYAIRHIQSEQNTKQIISSAKDRYPLTENGIKDFKKIIKNIKDLKIDIIFTSEILRAKQTAEIINQALSVGIIYDKRLNETNFGEFEERNCNNPEVIKMGKRWLSENNWSPKDGESLNNIGKRMFDFWQEINNKYENKNILIVSHGDPIRILQGKLAGFKDGEITKNVDMLSEGQLVKLEERTTDIHIHFVNNITWPCKKCSGRMRRISEVLDCWVESGSMSFAQMHYPFENKEKFEKNFPAQFISEYISQTRAWFYVMHVMSTALFDSHSFENVIATGVILNEKGEKLSKSKKNYPDPWKVINEYGVDSLRYYLMSSSLMQAENLFFNERELRDVFRKNIMLLWNIYKFYELFKNENKDISDTDASNSILPSSENILDKWILAKLNVLIKEVTENMKIYNLPKATRPISDFINDFSTWYIRRSRERFKSPSLTSPAPDVAGEENACLLKGGEREVIEYSGAPDTTRYVLLQLTKIMAPVMPFMAEQIWQKVSGYDFKDENKSVHLEGWPLYDDPMEKEDLDILKQMEVVRKIVELGLKARDEAGIKVRQAIASLKIKNQKSKIKNEFVELLSAELNVKKIDQVMGEGEISLELDTTMSEELKLEGLKREIVRMVNNLRKQAGLTIKDKITLCWQSDSDLVKEVFKNMMEEIKKDTLSGKIENKEGVEMKETVVNGEKVKLGISKK